MKLSFLAEMGKPAQVCPKCGHGPMHKTHYYNTKATDPADKWKCRQAPLAGYPLQGGSAAPAAPTPASSPVAAPAAAPHAPAPVAQPRPVVAHTPVAAPRAKPVGQGDLPAQIKKFLEDYKITKYTINDDHSVDVDQDVFILDYRHRIFPVKFNTVKGDFHLAGGSLQSLKNAPDVVDGDFQVTHQLFTSLEGMPSQISGSVDLSNNEHLGSLDGMKPGTTLGGDFVMKGCKKLKSLKGIGRLITTMRGTADFSETAVSEAILGLLQIKGISGVRLPDATMTEIMERYISQSGSNDAIHHAQEDLIDNDFIDAAEQ